MLLHLLGPPKSLNYELTFFLISSYSKNKSGASNNILFVLAKVGAGFLKKASIQIEGNHIGVNVLNSLEEMRSITKRYCNSGLCCYLEISQTFKSSFTKELLLGKSHFSVDAGAINLNKEIKSKRTLVFAINQPTSSTQAQQAKGVAWPLDSFKREIGDKIGLKSAKLRQAHSERKFKFPRYQAGNMLLLCRSKSEEEGVRLVGQG